MADPVAALLLCAPSAGPVALSIINGHVVVRDGRLLTVDAAELTRHANARAAALAQKAS